MSVTKDHTFQINQLIIQTSKIAQTIRDSTTTLSDVNDRLVAVEAKLEGLVIIHFTLYSNSIRFKMFMQTYF